MTYPRFLAFNLVGLLWVLSFVYAGRFGNLPVVRHNFTLLIFGIIAVSLLPMVIGMVKARRSASKATSEGA